jgi:hypothetical protein
VTSTLYVAAGGGGDAIAATILANRATPGEQAAIATYAWDRLIIDPLPGPRGAQDFNNLTEHAPHVWEITPHTTPKPPAGSTLPRLARELHARLFLLDPYTGAVGMAQQLSATARFLGTSSLVLVDVGGDLVARGDEPELRSPLADALALTACELAGLPYQAIVAGPGVDGELTEQQVIERCQVLHGEELSTLTAVEVEPYAAIFDWHPSEATGLWTAAIRGHRGKVEIRDAGLPVFLADTTTGLYEVPTSQLLRSNTFATALMLTESLHEAEAVVQKIRGSTELDYERYKANRRHPQTEIPSISTLIEKINQTSKTATQRTDYLTVRRLAELLKFPALQFDLLIKITRGLDENRLTAPLWSVHQ